MRETLKTPKEIEVLLHYHCYPTPHPQAEAISTINAVNKLLECGALGRSTVPPGNPILYNTTDLGYAWVEALKRVPIPRVAYVDERGDMIELRGRKAPPLQEAPARRRNG